MTKVFKDPELVKDGTHPVDWLVLALALVAGVLGFVFHGEFSTWF